jgi:hypothetical protein
MREEETHLRTAEISGMLKEPSMLKEPGIHHKSARCLPKRDLLTLWLRAAVLKLVLDVRASKV